MLWSRRFTYFGGKQQLAKYYSSIIPKHTLYCEPYFGGERSSLRKNPSEIEVINDSNGELITSIVQCNITVKN